MTLNANSDHVALHNRILSSSVGGMLTSFIMTPLDVIKIRMQDAAYKIVRNEGVLSLWSGLLPTLAIALPQTVLYFTVNDWLKEYLGYDSLNAKNKCHGFQTLSSNDFIPPLVGGVSRIFAVSVISPIELLRTKMQSMPLVPSEIWKMVVKSVKQDGVQSLWRGMGPTLLRDVPYSMLFWMVYDYLKLLYLLNMSDCNGLHLPGDNNFKFLNVFAFGAFSGSIAGIITHPFDVIKTHRQIQLGNSLCSGCFYPKSTWRSISLLYTHNGIKGLYAGFTPRLLKTTFASAIMVATFESLKQKLNA